MMSFAAEGGCVTGFTLLTATTGYSLGQLYLTVGVTPEPGPAAALMQAAKVPCLYAGVLYVKTVAGGATAGVSQAEITPAAKHLSKEVSPAEDVTV
jgi:hypothetical protein